MFPYFDLPTGCRKPPSCRLPNSRNLESVKTKRPRFKRAYVPLIAITPESFVLLPLTDKVLALRALGPGMDLDLRGEAVLLQVFLQDLNALAFVAQPVAKVLAPVPYHGLDGILAQVQEVAS